MNALARAIATATPSATRATSDVAKTREEKGRQGTTPHHKAFVVAGSQDQGVLSQGAANGGVSQRFWAKVSAGLGCWIWEASKSRSGYGQFWDGETMVRAHRWAYTDIVGAIPDDVECDHLCGNKECVNPWHIELVTHAVNVERRTYRHSAERRQKMSDAAKARWAAIRAEREREAAGWWVCI